LILEVEVEILGKCGGGDSKNMWGIFIEKCPKTSLLLGQFVLKIFYTYGSSKRTAGSEIGSSKRTDFSEES
jgi:hypothetical protein